MGRYLINYPDIADIDLVFDKNETKEIFVFFYPAQRSAISALEITNDARRLAQTMLIAAVDASISMSYVDILANSLRFLPGRSVESWMRKLSQGLIKKWFKNATQKDLLKVKIYESVRTTIAVTCETYFRELLDGVAKIGRPRSSYALV